MKEPLTGKGSHTRTKILDSAIHIFAKQGFANTSIQSIADDCKITQTAVLYHFENKEGLILAVVDRFTRHNHDLVAHSMQPIDNAYHRLLKHFTGNLQWGTELPRRIANFTTALLSRLL